MLSFPLLPCHQPQEECEALFEQACSEQISLLNPSKKLLDSLHVGFSVCPRQRFCFELVCERSEVRFVCFLFDWSLLQMQLEQASRQDLLLIFEECISNVLRHSYREEEEKWLSFEVIFEHGMWTLLVFDKGEKGRVCKLQEKLDAIPLVGRPPIRRGGMGLYLIRRMMDEVTYQAGEINCLVLKKRVSIC